MKTIAIIVALATVVSKDTHSPGNKFGVCLRPWGTRVQCDRQDIITMSYKTSVEYAMKMKSRLPTIIELRALVGNPISTVSNQMGNSDEKWPGKVTQQMIWGDSKALVDGDHWAAVTNEATPDGQDWVQIGTIDTGKSWWETNGKTNPKPSWADSTDSSETNHKTSCYEAPICNQIEGEGELYCAKWLIDKPEDQKEIEEEMPSNMCFKDTQCNVGIKGLFIKCDFLDATEAGSLPKLGQSCNKVQGCEAGLKCGQTKTINKQHQSFYNCPIPRMDDTTTKYRDDCEASKSYGFYCFPEGFCGQKSTEGDMELYCQAVQITASLIVAIIGMSYSI